MRIPAAAPLRKRAVDSSRSMTSDCALPNSLSLRLPLPPTPSRKRRGSSTTGRYPNVPPPLAGGGRGRGLDSESFIGTLYEPERRIAATSGAPERLVALMDGIRPAASEILQRPIAEGEELAPLAR